MKTNDKLKDITPQYLEIEFILSSSEMEVYIAMPLALFEDKVTGCLYVRGPVSKAKNLVEAFRGKVKDRVEMLIRKAKAQTEHKHHLMVEALALKKINKPISGSLRERIDLLDKAEYEYSSAACRLGVAMSTDAKYLDLIENL